MKRSILTVTLAACVIAMMTMPTLAADPKATKQVLGGGETSIVLVRVSATSDAIYGVAIEASSESISNIVADRSRYPTFSDSHMMPSIPTPAPKNGESSLGRSCIRSRYFRNTILASMKLMAYTLCKPRTAPLRP